MAIVVMGAIGLGEMGREFCGCVAKGMDIDEAYAKIISPYKGALEMWYQEHLNLWTDMMLIFLTAWVIVFPKSEIMNKIFKDDLPKRA